MGRLPSDATLLRQARSDLLLARRERDSFKADAYEYRVRATKAEQEVAEWKQRFDLLLKRTPESEVCEHE